MKGIVKVTLLLVGLLALSLFSGLIPLGMSATLRGVGSVLSSEPDTLILEGKGLLVFAWPDGPRQAFVVLSQTGDTVKNLAKVTGGQATAFNNFAEFYSCLLADGFRRITPDQVPPQVVNGIAWYSSFWGRIIGGLAREMPVFFIVAAPDTFSLYPTGIPQ